MRKINCFDVVEMVVEEANKRFAPLWELDHEQYKAFEKRCEMIDKLMDDCDAETLEVEVDEIKMQVKITIEGTKPRVDVRLLSLSGDGSLSYGVRSDRNGVKIKFDFPSLWKRGK